MLVSVYSRVMSAQFDTNAAQWTIGRLLNWTADYLAQHNVADARLATEVLLAYAAGCRRIDLYARFEQVLEEDRLARFRTLVRRAGTQEPIAYLVGEKEFFSLPLRVTPDVLIPRPETEVLVECVLDHCTKARLARPRLLDLGTGSGCIAVTLLVQLSGAKAVATDVSPKALEVARFNARRHGVLDRLTLIEADCLALPQEVVFKDRFDVLVSNPPYIAADAVHRLDVSVRNYEPPVALTDGGDGLSFYRSVATDGPRLLTPQGVVFVEVDDRAAPAVVKTIEGAGGLLHRRTWKDQVVGQERVLLFSRNSKG